MEYTSSPKPQLSSRANAFSIAALMSSGKPSKDKEAEENTIKPLGKMEEGSSTKKQKQFNASLFIPWVKVKYKRKNPDC